MSKEKEEKKEERALSENKKLNKKIKIIAISIIVIALLWVFIINPIITFKSNEKEFTEAAKKYYNMYTTELPTGERVSDITLQELYEKGFLDRDFYVPYKLLKKTSCSVTDSWVKVKKIDGDYKYYTYLKCGILSSLVDHKGPKIILNGEEKITISLGEKYEEPGIKSIKDSVDGDIDIEKATITGEVNTNKIGTYTIKYSAIDSLKNKTEVIRKVSVVQKLNSTVKKATNNLGYYTGNPNNYIYFSGMLFRIVDVDGDDVRIVAARDIANVNHDGIIDWLDYFYDHINEDSKKLVVKNKYCEMTLQEANLNTTECGDYTKSLVAYIPSVADINKAQAGVDNFLKPVTMSWTSDKLDENTAYLTRDYFYNEQAGKSFVPYGIENNYGVRPMLTIKGDILIKSGDGTKENPYYLEDTSRGKADDLINSRLPGEYISIDKEIWRIIDAQEDGTTKVIYEGTLGKNAKYLQISYEEGSGNIYSLDSSKNIGYKINNRSSEYIDTKYFVNHEFEVPVYKKEVEYGKEIKVEKIKAKIAAPNMYEMFSAAPDNPKITSYWYINSSQTASYKYGVTDIGSAITEETQSTIILGVRPVAYLSKDCMIVSGSGTANDPYIISK